MRIAITGATGFVGAHLTSRLESEGHELVLIARRSRRVMLDWLRVIFRM